MAKFLSKFLKKEREQSRALCVFCGSPGVTKQHVFPDRIKKLISRPNTKTSIEGYIFNFDEKSLILKPYAKDRNGSVGTVQVRIVCEKCNSGWINNVEKAAFEPYLNDMILGKEIELDDDAQKKIAAWIAISTITAEYTHDESMRAISEEEREYLMTHKVAPKNWQIAVGKYHSVDHDISFRHIPSVSIALDEYKRLKSIGRKANPNMQLSVAIIGSLYFVASSAPSLKGEFIIDIEKEFNGLLSFSKIWPLANNNVIWPPAQDDGSYKNVRDIVYEVWAKFSGVKNPNLE